MEHENVVDPIHQFQIHEIIPLHLGGYNLSFTNSALFMVVTVAVASIFLMMSTGSRAIVPGRAQSISEMSYEFVAKTLRDAAGHHGMQFFPLVFSLFMFVLVANLLGMFPYFFTITSHIIVTFALAAMVWLTATFIGFWKHGFGYLKLFVPSGVPLWLMPVIVPIELISYFIRPVSHSVRLFANMTGGHTMLKVFAGFAVMLPWWGKIAPAGFMVAFTGLELLVAFLQALIFTVLTCIYVNDAVNMHH